MARRPVTVASLAAMVGALIWSAGIGLTVAAYNQQKAAGYSPFIHFISELGFPGTSSRTWVFNLTEVAGCLVALPIAWAVGAHLRTNLARVAASFAVVALLLGNFVGMLGLKIDFERPELISRSYLGLHLGAAIGCFGLWSVAVLLFTFAFVRRGTDTGSRAMTITGSVCFITTLLLLGAGISTFNALTEASMWRDPIHRAIWRGEATPQMFIAWLDAHREAFGWLSTTEWSLLITALLWHGAAAVFLQQQNRGDT